MTVENAGIILPSNVPVERSLLGALIVLEGNNLSEAREQLRDSNFTSDRNRAIWRALCNLNDRGEPILPATVSAELKRIGGADDVDLARLTEFAPRLRDISSLLNTLRLTAMRREIAKRAYRWFENATDLDDVDKIVNEIGRVALDWQTVLSKDKSAARGFYSSFSDLLTSDIQVAEELFIGVRRRQITELVSTTDTGKSTLLLNWGLSLASGQACLPIVPVPGPPLRILYLDFEATAQELRDYVEVMLGGIKDREAATANFIPVVEACIGDDEFSLSNSQHLNYVINRAKQLEADIVIIDTMASAFDLLDENSNSEVKRKIISPLKRLTREVNCAVIFAHHVGKANEMQNGEGAYMGRGASNFGALPRAVFTLKREKERGEGYVTLECKKGHRSNRVLAKSEMP